ncbi:MAG: glucose-6-phosphate dehydrogenase [Actinomycetota bacterium]
MSLKPVEPQSVVIFGATGDLTRRKLLPALYHLFIEDLLPANFAIVGSARSPMSDGQFREHAREAVEEFGRTKTLEKWDEFVPLLSYLAGDVTEEGGCSALGARLAQVEKARGIEGQRRLLYCATPPSVYPGIARRLGETGLAARGRLVLEKPFGRDLATARELNAVLHEAFDEEQIFRIDHYLGKETVQNILACRFANGMFEPIWNRRYVDNVQITVAEEIGLEGRGAFYDSIGTIRDMVQTHLFQVLTFVAMEPPVSFDPDRLRDEKVRVLRSMLPADPKRVVRGQYAGYRDEPDVATDSTTETFAALQIEIDNWRWAGVPFNLRTGKSLGRKVTEVSLSFRHVPYNVFRGTDAEPPGRDAIAFRLQPNEGISLLMNIKRPGLGMELDRAELDFDYAETFASPLLEAYEYLLLEVMEGDHSLFTREDEVERAWEVLQPLLDEPPPVIEYAPGSWGPEQAEELILPRHWHVTTAHEHRP